MVRYIVLALAGAALASCASEEQRMEGVARQALERAMIDPTSFLVRDIRLGNVTDGRRPICGQVNGKNRMGAYTGFEDFAVIEGDEPTLILAGAGVSEAQFALLNIAYCGGPEQRDALADKWIGPRRVADETAPATAEPKAAPEPARQSFVRDGVRHYHGEDEEEVLHGPYLEDYDSEEEFNAANATFWRDWEATHDRIGNGG